MALNKLLNTKTSNQHKNNNCKTNEIIKNNKETVIMSSSNNNACVSNNNNQPPPTTTISIPVSFEQTPNKLVYKKVISLSSGIFRGNRSLI